MPVRIGFVGTGGIAGHHFAQLEQVKDAQLVAFADLDQQRVEAAARRFGGKAYADPKKMLEAETLDAVYFCLPPHAHKDVEILAAQKGCALFVEKPQANNMKTAERIAAAIEDAGVLSAVGYHWRHMDCVVRTQKMLGEKKAPAPAMIYGRWLGNFPGPLWWRNFQQSGGQLVEQATHIVDTARYLAGDISRVFCMAAQREMHKVYPDSTVPDATALTVEFASGTVGYFSTASFLGSVSEVGLDIMVRNGVYAIRSTNSLEVRQDSGETHIYQGKNNPFLDEDRAFVEAVKTGKRTGIKSNYADALKTLRVTLAANQSAKTGKAVSIR